VTEHSFTVVIAEILEELFGQEVAKEVVERSDLVGYLNLKTRSASRGSKARGSFANLYAIYVLVEDKPCTRRSTRTTGGLQQVSSSNI
jgi:hypothetical protein